MAEATKKVFCFFRATIFLRCINTVLFIGKKDLLEVMLFKTISVYGSLSVTFVRHNFFISIKRKNKGDRV